MINTLRKLETEGDFINLVKNIFEKSTANIILNVESLKAFSLRLGTRQGCLFLPESLKKNNIQIRKEKVKNILFADIISEIHKL